MLSGPSCQWWLSNDFCLWDQAVSPLPVALMVGLGSIPTKFKIFPRPISNLSNTCAWHDNNVQLLECLNPKQYMCVAKFFGWRILTGPSGDYQLTFSPWSRGMSFTKYCSSWREISPLGNYCQYFVTFVDFWKCFLCINPSLLGNSSRLIPIPVFWLSSFLIYLRHHHTASLIDS